MGIFADWQIQAANIITPFEPQRERPGVLSFGCSSYGYDARVGYKFRVFSPINAKEIDPKNFDPAALVDVDLTPDKPHNMGMDEFSENTFSCSMCGADAGDVQDGEMCMASKPDHILIPPHSFALAETVEHFNIPRDCLALVVGKSTYARCFSRDTKVLLTNGKTPTLGQMADKPSIRRWGFGVNAKTGEYQVSEFIQPRFIGRENLVRITLDNGLTIDCTPDHKFLRHGGFYTAAEELVQGDGLVPLYTKRFKGRQSIWIPQLGSWLPAHWLSDNWNLRHTIYRDQPKTHRHHKDEDKTNDNPTNIERKDKSKHIRDHNAVYFGEGFDAELHSLLIRGILAERAKDPEWVKYVKRISSGKARKLWTAEEFKAQRERIITALRNSWTTERAGAAADRMHKLNANTTFAMRAARWTPERRKKQAEVMRKVRESYYGKGNHTVVSVKPIRGAHEVFCLTSQDTENFALANGVIVKNCGLVVNCTPLEPEWHGKVTVELSNTTPLPMRVYAGEGIMQVLFFRSDGYMAAQQMILEAFAKRLLVYGETLCGVSSGDPGSTVKHIVGKGTCRVSYADKRGKYQGQVGLTLPLVEDLNDPRR